MNEDTMCLMASQKKLKDKYKDPGVLEKINKSDMAGTMETIKGYLKSCHGVIRSPLANVMRKTKTAKVYGDCPVYATPDNEIITRMLHLPPEKNKLLSEKDAQAA